MRLMKRVYLVPFSGSRGSSSGIGDGGKGGVSSRKSFSSVSAQHSKSLFMRGRCFSFCAMRRQIATSEMTSILCFGGGLGSIFRHKKS